MMMMMMIISPLVWPMGCGRPVRGVVVNQITAGVGTRHGGFLAIHFVEGQAVPVDQFLKLLRNTEGVKEHRILVEGKLDP
jgi:hypothetical protein